MLEGQTHRGAGLEDQDPFAGLINAEISVWDEAAKDESLHERSMASEELSGVAMQTFGDRMAHPLEDRRKVQWLSEWAMDLGVRGATEFLNLMASMDQAGSQLYPRHRFIDRIYRMAREDRARQDLEEARRV